ncbi:Electron transport complex subunit RnfE [BD1-7 clade bacterium]|uniref:Ion-translocating oxidoreductase complex subunit E n=1 Tax=BD1-7 clade bacterium TaxID=2029982 RepID=A0A5S9PV30_9GAMM|nr:Electron transport complex subunit RnfE [BD1-7 clade bacterium]CAA0108117.1 Electron transport complex subunit RnfE [BD1-7 clade bacterium]CAA0108131.1 Electron transport complex subunit RnfE [BD1-7 clade bacterium]
MATATYKEITQLGLWKNNPALVQLLGLCPLLAMSGSVVNSIGMGIATTFVLVTSNISVSLIRNIVSDAVRLPAFVMIIAAAVTAIQILMQAFAYSLYEVLGVFLPLITTNCVILGRADAFACKNRVLPAAYDGLMMGLGFSIVMFLLGFFRELFGTGHVFADMQLLFGPMAENWMMTPFPNYPQFLYIVLPPGAFIFTGFMIALKNMIDDHYKKLELAAKADAPKEDRRVRVTGNVS